MPTDLRGDWPSLLVKAGFERGGAPPASQRDSSSTSPARRPTICSRPSTSCRHRALGWPASKASPVAGWPHRPARSRPWNGSRLCGRAASSQRRIGYTSRLAGSDPRRRRRRRVIWPECPQPSGAIEPVEQLPTRLRWVYESAMIGLALLVVALLIRPNSPTVHATNLAIWAVFALDFAIRIALSGDRRRWLRRNIPDLVAVLPLDFLRIARLAQLARLVRLMRAGRVLWRVSATLRGVLQTNGLAWVLATATTVVVAGELLIRVVEPAIASFGDALWWSIVTATTVGYGDLSPESALGRIVAVVLMLVGIGTIGMITGSIATYFLQDRRGLPKDPHLEFVRQELDRWNEMTPDQRRRIAALLTDLANQN